MKIRANGRLFLEDIFFPIFELAEQLERWLSQESTDIFEFETYSAQENLFLIFDCSEAPSCHLWSAHQQFEGAVVREPDLRNECQKFVEEFSSKFNSLFPPLRFEDVID